MWRTTLAATCLALVATACGGAEGANSNQRLLDNASLTMVIDQDPGNLDPQNSVLVVDSQIAVFAYDSLVNQDAKGKLVSGLAQSWQQSGNTYTFVLRPGITCSDGSKLTATEVAANFTYLADPKSKSPLLGLYVPPGLKASGNDASRTVTLTLQGPYPFFLLGMTSVPVVCQKGLDNRKLLAQHTDGTGPYELVKAVSSDRYTYKLRPGYTWGPAGATSKAKGMPSTVVFKIVSNPSTAANLLLDGQVNISGVAQSDKARVDARNLAHQDFKTPAGEMYFNELAGRPAADPAVRRALIMAVDLNELGKVLTGGAGTPSHGMVTVDPKPCTGDPVSGNLPQHDVAQANALLDRAGWAKGSDGYRHKDGKTLALQLLYTTTPDTYASGAELAISQWRAVGAKVTGMAKPDTQISSTLFGTGAWDISWAQLTVQFPSMLVPFLSGAVPPNGTNFGHVHNADYERLTKAAASKPDAAGCADWNAAETALVKAVDVVPYYDQLAPTYAKDANFAMNGNGVVPMSLRRVAG